MFNEFLQCLKWPQSGSLFLIFSSYFESLFATLTKVVLEQLKEKVQIFQTCSVDRIGNWPQVYFFPRQVGLEVKRVAHFQVEVFSVQPEIMSGFFFFQKHKTGFSERQTQSAMSPIKAPSSGWIPAHRFM